MRTCMCNGYGFCFIASQDGYQLVVQLCYAAALIKFCCKSMVVTAAVHSVGAGPGALVVAAVGCGVLAFVLHVLARALMRILRDDGRVCRVAA